MAVQMEPKQPVISQEKRQESIKYKIFILKMSRRKQIKTIQIVWSLAYRNNARNQRWRVADRDDLDAQGRSLDPSSFRVAPKH